LLVVCSPVILHKSMSNINDTYFDGLYKDIWKNIIPAELTPKEVDFIIPYFKLQQDSSVLDLMCGYGRHALALAAKGIHVTAVDNLPDYINELKKNAEAENLPVEAVLADVIQWKAKKNYDLVICMGNSLQFFDKGELMRLLKNISAHLKDGGHVFINTWSIMEIAVKHFKENSSGTIGAIQSIAESKYFYSPSRIETEHKMITADGTTEIKKGIDYIWSLNEIENLLNECGIKMKEVFSVPGKRRFSLGDARAYIIAEKS